MFLYTIFFMIKNNGLITSKPQGEIPNFDFASLYPTVMKVYNDNLIKLINRRKKINKILNNIDENII